MNWIAKQDARHRIVISLAIAAAVWFALRGRVQVSTQSIVTWDVFAVCVLVLAWLTILTTPPEKLRARAQMQDLSHIVIFVFVLVAACRRTVRGRLSVLQQGGGNRNARTS